MSKAICVFCVYKPKAGKAKELEGLLAKHVPTLRNEGFATARKTQVYQAPSDGSLLEIFEWNSEKAINEAHANPAVQKIWGDLESVAAMAKLTDLKEAGEMFPDFHPLDSLNC